MDARKAAKRYGQPVQQRCACVAEDEFGAKRGLGSQNVFLALSTSKAVPVALSRIEVTARAYDLIGRSAVERGLELAIIRREASTCPLGLVKQGAYLDVPFYAHVSSVRLVQGNRGDFEKT
ncbi:hypothetical protein [Parolsenella sp.]|uniref:hypothetical protein n=1 Tax=Parolsenella sp. TaxID=2083006 RepID=UPI002E77775F|nr:hypothetical protein [Parolsenella sp.]